MGERVTSIIDGITEELPQTVAFYQERGHDIFSDVKDVERVEGGQRVVTGYGTFYMDDTYPVTTEDRVDATRSHILVHGTCGGGVKGGDCYIAPEKVLPFVCIERHMACQVIVWEGKNTNADNWQEHIDQPKKDVWWLF